jgi:hypothetical protein
MAQKGYPMPDIRLCTAGCGRRYVVHGRGEPSPFVCSWCRVKAWEATRTLSAGELRRRSKAWLAKRYPAVAQKRAELLERAEGIV